MRSSTCPPTPRTEYVVAQANALLTTRRPLHRGSHPGARRRHFPMEAAAARSTTWTSRRSRSSARRDLAHPVPRARRRPAPSWARTCSARPCRSCSRRRRSSSPASKGAPRATPARSSSRRRGAVLALTADRIRNRDHAGEHDEYNAAQVRPLEPGHLHQPAADGRRRRPRAADGADADAAPTRTASSRSARTCSSPS